MRTKLNRLINKGARQPLRPYPIKSNKKLRVLDKTKPLLPAPEAINWLVVMTAPRRETDAVAALREAGYHAWYPQLTTWIHSARLRIKSKVNRPLFSRYIFVAQRDGCSKSITDIDHVGYIIGPVPPGRKNDRPLLDALSERQALGEFDGTKLPPPFTTDQHVTLTEGPFAGLSGIVAKADHERTLVLLQILGSDRPVQVATATLRVVA